MTTVSPSTRKRRNARHEAAEEVIAVVAKYALASGATLEQLEAETGRGKEEIERLLKRLEDLEQAMKEN